MLHLFQIFAVNSYGPSFPNQRHFRIVLREWSGGKVTSWDARSYTESFMSIKTFLVLRKLQGMRAKLDVFTTE